MSAILNILNIEIYHNTIGEYIFAILIISSIIITGKYIQKIGISVASKYKNKIPTSIDNAIIHILSIINWPFYLALSCYILTYYLRMPTILARFLFGIWVIIGTYYVVLFLKYIIIDTRDILIQKNPIHASISMIKIVSNIIIYIMWGLAVILILSNLGFAVSPIVTILSVISIAVPLALQKILGDIVASFSLLTDKPFEEGDFVVVGEYKGTIRRIGLKTTRIWDLSGEELIIPNSYLTNTAIKNFGKMLHRRIAFDLQIKFDTPIEKLREVPNIIKSIVESKKHTIFDRCHFKTIGQSALIYEIVYFVNNKDYNIYMDIQQQINIDIMSELKKHDIQIFHTNVYVSKS